MGMKLHSYAINSARVDRLYSGNNCLESIRNKIILLMDERDTYNSPPYSRPFCRSRSKPHKLFQNIILPQ
jgi:hypothetical protein